MPGDSRSTPGARPRYPSAVEPAASGGSIPNLRARQPVWIAIMVVFALALAGAVVAYIVFRVKTSNPGADACARIEALVSASPRDDAVATVTVDHLVRVVEQGMVELHLTESTAVKVGGTTRAERCRGALRTLDDGMRGGRYEELLACMTGAATVANVGACIRDAGL